MTAFVWIKILDFSETTLDVIDGLETDVEVISLIPESDITREILQIKEILAKYDSLSDHISVKNVDAGKNPGFSKI